MEGFPEHLAREPALFHALNRDMVDLGSEDREDAQSSD